MIDSLTKGAAHSTARLDRAKIRVMVAVPFDTLAFARKLRDNAGFAPEHAEVAATAITESVQAQDLATKQDWELLKRDLQIWFGRMIAWQTGAIIAVLGGLATLLRFVT